VQGFGPGTMGNLESAIKKSIKDGAPRTVAVFGAPSSIY
jgi:hypothetical protein